MEKLNYFCGRKTTPETWQPCHVKEIIDYLILKGYQYEVYKELHTSKFVLKNKNAVIFYKNCKEICEDLVELYFQEKEQDEIQYYKERAERDKRANKNFVMVFKK